LFNTNPNDPAHARYLIPLPKAEDERDAHVYADCAYGEICDRFDPAITQAESFRVWEQVLIDSRRRICDPEYDDLYRFVMAFEEISMTTENVVALPRRDLMDEAMHERSVVDSPEAQELIGAIQCAVLDYSQFLERHGLIWEDHFDADGNLVKVFRRKAAALVVTLEYDGCDDTVDIIIKGGALDRVYGDGVNPDPTGRGPPDIPRKSRPVISED